MKQKAHTFGYVSNNDDQSNWLDIPSKYYVYETRQADKIITAQQLIEIIE